MSEQVWLALSVDEVHRLLAPMSVPWWIAGGLAIDLFLGRTSRVHRDIDVQILRGTEHVVAGQLRGWELFTAKAGTLEPWHSGEQCNAIWCRPSNDAPWALELLVAEVADGRWIYRRQPRISRALADIGQRTADGIPFLRPEIQLLYKAKRVRPQDDADFRAVLPALDLHARAWLERALTTIDPAHLWLERLRSARGA